MDFETYDNHSELLSDPLFVKWGITISILMWKKEKDEISVNSGDTVQYMYKTIKLFDEDKSFDERWVSNGGRNKKLIYETIEVIRDQSIANKALSADKLS